MDPAFAAIVGAIVGAAAVVAAQFLTARASWKIERGQRLADRLTEFLSASHQASLSIGQVARAPIDLKAAAIREFVWPELDRVNSAFEAVLLHDVPKIAEAAKRLDELLIQLDDLSQTKQWEVSEWRLHRDTVMNDQLNLVRGIVAPEVRRATRFW